MRTLYVVLSMFIMAKCGSEGEWNPIAAWLFGQYGVVGFIVLKVVSVSTILFVYWYLGETFLRKLLIWFACGSVATTVVLGIYGCVLLLM